MQVEFRLNKKRYALFGLGCLLIIVVCTLGMYLVGRPVNMPQSVMFAGLCLLAGPSLFGLCYYAYLLFEKKPVLTIDNGGLYDRYSDWGTVRWHNVHRIFGHQRGKRKYINLAITDASTLIKQTDLGSRMAFERELERSKEHISILINRLEGNPDEIFEQIRQRWKEATGRQ